MKVLIILLYMLITISFASENNSIQPTEHKVFFEKEFNQHAYGLLFNAIEHKQHIYIVGRTAEGRSSTYDTEKPLISKLNQSGKVIWSKTLKNHFGSFFSIAIDKHSNIYAVGRDYSPSKKGYRNDIEKALIIKFNNNGKIIWEKIIGTTKYDSFHDIKIIDDNLYILGITYSKKEKNQSQLIKMDFNAAILFSKILYNNHDIFYKQHITVDKDKNIYITNNIRSKKPSISKYSQNGKEIFTKDINTVGLFQIAIDNDNNLYTISIDTKPNLATNIIKLNNDGNIIWKKNIHLDKKNFPRKIIDFLQNSFSSNLKSTVKIDEATNQIES